jgi:hypothetical protein
MGYWSTHPLGGDSPSDFLGGLKDFMFTKLTEDEFKAVNDTIPEKRRYKNLQEAIEDGFFAYESKEGCEPLYEAMKRIANDHIEEIVSCKWIEEGYEDPEIFAIPFAIVENGWYLTPDNLAKVREALIKLIGDGGADERGYDNANVYNEEGEFVGRTPDEELIKEITDPDGELPSPAHYAALLRLGFDDFVTGVKGFKVDTGLLGAFNRAFGDKPEDTGHKLINVK